MADALPGIDAAVIGGGPAGLMAAEVLATAGQRVAVFDAMPSVGRKFLLAGKGGLNLTHSESFNAFCARYAEARSWVQPWLQAFGADALRAWAAGLGIDTFVGSSGRVFPTDMKAAPLLRAWLHRLRAQGVQFHMRHRWLGWAGAGAIPPLPLVGEGRGEGGDALRFDSPSGERSVLARTTVLALGGASWPRLGSDGAWVPLLQAQGVPVQPLKPANCGFDVDWSDHFRAKHAGAPLKSVRLSFRGWQQLGEMVLTEQGAEGSLVYAASGPLRDAIEAEGTAEFTLDLLPARSLEWVTRELAHPRGPRSLSTHLKTRLNLSGARAGLLWELVPREVQADPAAFAARIKALPIRVLRPRPVAEAISTAGGVSAAALDDVLMLRARPGTFCCGEMLDWEAPTGGYLLTACFASAQVAGAGAARWLATQP